MSAAAGKRLAQARLASQGVTRGLARSPADVVRSMTAMQAQDFAGAKWAVGLRLPGSTEAQVEAALADGSIVRSWPMRGTLHFVAPEDLGWILGLTTDRLVSGAAGRQAALGLDERQFETARVTAVEALNGGRALTREQLQAAFAEAGVSVEAQRGYHILWYLAQTGTLCFGPPQGKQQTFVLLDEWVRHPRRLQHDEALGELAERYFCSHGPATLRDFAWWSSLTMKDARTGLAIVRTRLTEAEVEGSVYYLSPEAEEAPAVRGIWALPGFDEFLLGYQDRSAQLTAEHSGRIAPGANGIFQPTIVADGRVVGTWKRTITKRGIRVEPLPFAPLSGRAKAGFALAAAGYAEFLGLELID